METQYKKIFLQKGLEMLSDYQFRSVKSLLVGILNLTSNMLEDDDRIKIADRMFFRFPGAKCVAILIDLIKDNRELENLTKSLKQQMEEVRRRLQAAKSSKKKRQLDRVSPLTPEHCSSSSGTPQGAAEEPVAQKRKKFTQAESEPQGNPASQNLLPLPVANEQLNVSQHLPSPVSTSALSSESSVQNPRPQTFPKATTSSLTLWEIPIVVKVLQVSKPFPSKTPGSEERILFHATVATTSEYFPMKVFIPELRAKFLSNRVLCISRYIKNKGFLEVREPSSITEEGPEKKIKVPSIVLDRAKKMPKICILHTLSSGTVVSGFFTLGKKSAKRTNTIYNIWDNTGNMDVVGQGQWHNLPCREGDKLWLFGFRMRKSNQKNVLISEEDSWIQVTKMSPSRSVTLPEASADRMTPTINHTPQSSPSSSSQTKSLCPVLQVPKAHLKKTLFPCSDLLTEVATCTSSTQQTPSATHWTAQSSSFTPLPAPDTHSSSLSSSSVQLSDPTPLSPAQSSNSTQLTTPTPYTTGWSSSSTQEPTPTPYSSPLKLSSTKLSNSAPHSSTQSSSSNQISTPSPQSLASSSSSTQQPHPGPQSSSGSSSSAQKPHPGPQSSSQSSSSAQQPHPGPQSSSRSSFSAQGPYPVPLSPAQSSNSTQLTTPTPYTIGWSSSSTQEPTPTPHSSPLKLSSTKLSNPTHHSSTQSSSSTQTSTPSPRSLAWSSSSTQRPHPGSQSFVQSSSSNHVPQPTCQSSTQSSSSAQRPHPGPQSSSGSPSSVQRPHSGPQSSTGSSFSVQRSHPGPQSSSESLSLAQRPHPQSSSGNSSSAQRPHPGPHSSAQNSSSTQCVSRLVATFQEEGLQTQRKEVVVLSAMEPFIYRRFEEDSYMFYATVATQGFSPQIIHVKVFHESFKAKFVRGNIVALSNYIGHRGFMEVYEKTSVEDTGVTMQVPYNLIRKARATPKIRQLLQKAPGTLVNGVFTVRQKIVRGPCVYYQIQDNTGVMEVLVFGHLSKIPCESGDRVELTCFELGENQLRSVIHSFLKVLPEQRIHPPSPQYRNPHALNGTNYDASHSTDHDAWH